MGYVGLPLAKSFVQKGAKVYGFDIDKKKINELQVEANEIFTKNKYFGRKKGKSFARLEQFQKYLVPPSKEFFKKIKLRKGFR